MTVAALLVAAVLAGPASAGSYPVNACSPSTSPGVWASVNTFPASFTSGNLCGGLESGPSTTPANPNPGALYAEDNLNSGADIPDGASAGWTFTAPTGTAITAISYYRTLAAYNNEDLVAGLYQANGAALDQCKIASAFGSSIVCSMPNSQQTVFTGLNTSSLFFGVACHIVTGSVACLAGGAPLHAVRAQLYSARVTLFESSPPTLSAPTGTLWGGGNITGNAQLTFAASDPSGIAKEVLSTETGQIVYTATPTCTYTSFQPCPQQPTTTVNINTGHFADSPFTFGRVPDGPHSFTLTVTDAAGNTTSATSPSITVHNTSSAAPPPSTVGGTSRARLAAVIDGRWLRVHAALARTGRVKVSWRATRHHHTVGHGSRVVTIHHARIAVRFALSTRARRGATAVAIRSGKRIIVSARAHRTHAHS